VISTLRSVVRASAFLRAEVFESLRQPRLILTLVVGPFVILLLFAIGYHNDPRALRTLFVAKPGTVLANDIEQTAPTLGPELIYEGTTGDQASALDRLRRGQVDIVCVAPDQPKAAITSSRQATFIVYHNEIDPTQRDYAKYFAQIDIDAVNRRLLTQTVEDGTSSLPGNVDPQVLVGPLRVETRGVASVQPTLAEFYAPAVLALLLQHIAVTFASLSIVRERQLGTMELFRVSPVSSVETLIGKYLSYLVLGGLVGGILGLVLVYGLRVPMLGDWRYLALALAAMLFASLGLGFIISLVSQTDTQAVQYSMMVLLASVFFSGFIMRLQTLWAPVQVISWAIPATYGIVMLQDIMLRGPLSQPMVLAAVLAIGSLLFFVALWLLCREMGRR
jgi:ABC-2 type transport system permease protein